MSVYKCKNLRTSRILKSNRFPTEGLQSTILGDSKVPMRGVVLPQLYHNSPKCYLEEVHVWRTEGGVW